MRARLALPVLAALSACAPAAQVGARSLPGDVAAFVERRDACDHFRGEEPYDAERAAELKMRLAEACAGTDAELARLRARYVGDAAVTTALSGYEPSIEGAPR